MNLVVSGIQNPVRAAEAYLRAQGCAVDGASFDLMADRAGIVDAPAEGFMVDGYDALCRLCQIGKFNIWTEDGVAVARDIAELPL